MSVPEISVEQLKSLMDSDKEFTLLDVREPHEVAEYALPSLHIPLGALPERYQALNPQDNIIIYCRSGGRSGKATAFLQSKGFTYVRNLTGGMIAWREAFDS